MFSFGPAKQKVGMEDQEARIVEDDISGFEAPEVRLKVEFRLDAVAW